MIFHYLAASLLFFHVIHGQIFVKSVSDRGILTCPNRHQRLSLQEVIVDRMHDELRKKRWSVNMAPQIKSACDFKSNCNLANIMFPPHRSITVGYTCFTYIEPLALQKCMDMAPSTYRVRRGLEDAVDAVLSDVGTMIQMFRTVAPNQVITSGNGDPVIEYGQERLRNDNLVPTYMIAEIRYRHLPPPNSRPNIPGSTYNHLHQNMGGYHNDPNHGTDDAGHLLAHALGGETHALNNFIPMTRNVNRGQNSLWYRMERRIADHLRHNMLGHVLWQVVVLYTRTLGYVMTDPRPVGVAIQYTLFDDAGNADRVPAVTFSNDPGDEGCYVAYNQHE